MEEAFELLNFHCSDKVKSDLVTPVLDTEIMDVLYVMPSNKAHGHDGCPAEFYKALWPIIKHDFIVAVQSFFTQGFLPSGVNATIIQFISKHTNAQHMIDYQPIACLNMLYKVISKILANCLKKLFMTHLLKIASCFRMSYLP